MNVIKCKCYICKNDINTYNKLDKSVYYDSHFYHVNCFLKWCKEKNTTKRKNALKKVEQYIESASLKTNELLLKKRIDHDSISKFEYDAENEIKEWFAKSDVDSLIRTEYGINPPWRKLNFLYEGKDPRLNKSLPATDLIYMWEQKMPYLRKLHCKLENKDNGYSMCCYDLSVIVGKYEGYLNWKRQQDVLAAENRRNSEELERGNLVQIVFNNTKNNQDYNFNETDNEDLDISNVVNEIFE